jgi:hypothetical protein
MLGAILAAAAAIQSVAGAVHDVAGTGIFAGLTSSDPNDKTRIAAASSALQKALAGDLSQITYMQNQAGMNPGAGSATAVGKEAFRRALVAYDQAKGTHYAPAGSAPAMPAPSPAQSVLSQTQHAVQQDVAGGLQQLLTGGVNSITHAISPSAGTSVPFSQNQMTLIYAGLALVAVLLIPKLIHRGHA